MKILVATSDVPFVEGGHRVIARALVEAFRQAGHDSEILTTPTNRFGRQFAAYASTRLTDVEFTGTGERVDRLVSLRFPSYVLKHPNHVCWLNHRMREYYDLWGQWNERLSWKGRIKERVRKSLIHAADNHYLKSNLRKLYAQSKNIQLGLRTWGNIPSELLYPPPGQREYRTIEYGDFIFSPARLTPLKRISLLVEAIAQTPSGKAIIAGEGPEEQNLKELIRGHSLEGRIRLVGRLDEAELVDLYARCRAVYYAPLAEDYGLVPVEAFRSRKPVLTSVDSGGAMELVRDGHSGFIVPADASSLASKITILLEDKPLAEKMGAAGYVDTESLTWPETVARLLS